VDELDVEYRKQEDQRSCLEKPGMRFCDLILGPPSSWAELADRLEEATIRLGAKLAT
jgi:hypothetical protein